MTGGRWTPRLLVVGAVLVLTACSGTTPVRQASSSDGAYQPPRNVTFLSGNEPGGGIDLAINTVMSTLKESGLVDTNMRIDHLPGGSGLVATASLTADHQGDEDILFLTSLSTLAASIQQGDNSNANLADLVPVSRLFAEYSLMYVPDSSPFRTLDDVLDKIKSDPGSVEIGGPTLSSPGAMTVAQIAIAAGTEFSKVKYIPHEPSEHASALLGGHVDVFIGGTDLYNLVESGDVRALAISSQERAASFPDIPTYVEQGYDVVQANWRGIFAPPGISAQAVAFWSDAFERMVDQDGFTKVAGQYAWDAQFQGSDDFAEFLTDETEATTKVLRDLKLLD